MKREEIRAIAVKFVDLLAKSEVLRKETADSFAFRDHEAVLARIVTTTLELDPPLEVADIGEFEDEMAEVFKRIRRRRRLPCDIRQIREDYSTGRG